MCHTTCSGKRKLCNKNQAVDLFSFSSLLLLSEETLVSKLTKQLREICHEEFSDGVDAGEVPNFTFRRLDQKRLSQAVRNREKFQRPS